MDLLLSQRVLWVNVSHQLHGQLKALEDTHDGEDIVKIEEDLKMRTFSNISTHALKRRTAIQRNAFAV